MVQQLTLLDTKCCKHCRRLDDGRCRWLTEKRMDTHITYCLECGEPKK